MPGVSTTELQSVGVYERPLAASLGRLYENALDWEHLPHLHASAFRSIECLDAGPWGWRAEIGLQPRGDIVLELLLDPDAGTWVSRTLDGVGAGSEIWTQATGRGDRASGVRVEFLLSGVRPEAKARLGAYYADRYRRLYDEDEWMMTERQRALDARAERRPPPTRVVELDDGPVAFEARCPHLLGPLGEAPVVDGVVTCPWHGYRFDVRTGRNLDGHACRLRPVPVGVEQ